MHINRFQTNAISCQWTLNSSIDLGYYGTECTAQTMTLTIELDRNIIQYE